VVSSRGSPLIKLSRSRGSLHVPTSARLVPWKEVLSWKELCWDTSHIENFNDVFGNLYRHLFQVLLRE
jgi:hypothetical protein